MNYCYCTLAIGKKYFDDAIVIAKQLNEKSKNCNFVVVTDIDKHINMKNVTKIMIDIDKENFFVDRLFNYNLKYYPIKMSSVMDFEYIIFIDADWKILDSYSEKSLIMLFDYMNNNRLDFLFERPGLIGHNKHNPNSPETCFWKHKIEIYGLLDTDIYDKGHVVNEQFLVFKNNQKLKTFVGYWEKLENIAYKNKINPFAEGLEIGMSSAISEMNVDFLNWKTYLRNMFSFTTVDDIYFERF